MKRYDHSLAIVLQAGEFVSETTNLLSKKVFKLYSALALQSLRINEMDNNPFSLTPFIVSVELFNLN